MDETVRSVAVLMCDGLSWWKTSMNGKILIDAVWYMETWGGVEESVLENQFRLAASQASIQSLYTSKGSDKKFIVA